MEEKKKKNHKEIRRKWAGRIIAIIILASMLIGTCSTAIYFIIYNLQNKA